MTNKRRLIAFLVVLLLLAGCAGSTSTTTTGDSPQTTAWKSLNSMKAVYGATMETLAALYKQGKLSEAAKTNIEKYGNIYVSSHNQAVQDLMDGKTPNVDVVTAALNAFVAQAKPYTGGGK